MNTLIIARREFVSFFASPIAYVVAFMFLLVLGLIFASQFVGVATQGGSPQVEQWVLGPFVTLALFLGAATTMRLLAEENRTGTVELILTAPIREWELVVGKWLASFGFMLVVLALTSVYALITNANSTPPLDLGALLVAYLGVALLVGALLAIGVFASSLFSNQIAAFFASYALILGLWLAGLPLQGQTGAVADVFNYIDFSGHYYESFAQGVITLTDTVYFLSVIAFFLFAAARVVESRRWR